MSLIKEKAKSNKREISKDDAEKILKQSQNQDPTNSEEQKGKTSKKKTEGKKTSSSKTKSKPVKAKGSIKKTKKVSKK